MRKPKIFIACDTTNVTKVKRIIKQSQSTKIKVGYKFGLEFMNSKNGRQFISKLKNKIIFVDLKLNDTVNTMKSAVKALKDLKINYFIRLGSFKGSKKSFGIYKNYRGDDFNIFK